MVTELAPTALTADEARALTDQIKSAAERVYVLLLQAYEGRAWQVLGYDSWRDFAMAEFGMSQSYAYRLLDQARVIREIEAAGSPIGELPNEGQARELARVPEADRADIWRETVERTDGKPTAAAIRETYERTQTPACSPEPEPAGTDVAAGSGHDHRNAEPSPDDDLAAGRSVFCADVDEMDAALNDAAERYTEVRRADHPPTGASPAKPNRRPLPDAFRDATYDLVKVAERIDRLVTDDRYPRNAEQVGRTCRADLLRAVDLLAGVVDRIPNPTKESTE